MRLCFLPTLLCLAIFSAFGAESPRPPSDARLKELILLLNAQNPEEREKAQEELAAAGAAALPHLRDAAKSPTAEIAVRARRLLGDAQMEARAPKTTWAECLPAETVFLLEVPDVRRTLTRWRETAAAKMWELPGIKLWRKKVVEEAPEKDRAGMDAVGELLDCLGGRAAVFYSSPELADAFDAPFTYALETPDRPKAAHAPLRKLWTALDNAPNEERRYEPFVVEEHFEGVSVFGRTRYFYSKAEEGLEALLDCLVKPPMKNALPAWTAGADLLPDADVLLLLQREGLSEAAEGSWHFSEELVQALTAAGWTAPGRLWAALSFTPRGIKEAWRMTLPGNEGLLPFLRGAAPAVVPAENESNALDVMPPHLTALLTLNVDLAAQGEAFWGGVEKFHAAVAPRPVVLRPQKDDPAGKDAPAIGKKDGEKKADGKIRLAKESAEKEAAPPPLAEIWARCLPLPPKTFSDHCRGPIRLGVFFKQTAEDKEPEELPVEWMLTAVVKDPAALLKAMEDAAPKPAGVDLRGGRFFMRRNADDSAAGLWLRGDYLVWVSAKQLVELAADALERKNHGRLTDRADYKEVLADKKFDPAALITVFADGTQLMQMPYALGQIFWPEGPCGQAWPHFDDLKPFLGKLTAQITARADGLELRAESALSLFGIYAFFSVILEEAAF